MHIDDNTNKTITAIKGFNRDMTCRGFRFEEGQTYKHDGEVEACESGFHAIEGHPFEVFRYYAPNASVYREVELRGPFSRHGADSKIAAAEITIKRELKLSDLIDRAVKWVFDRAIPENTENATGCRGAASATGDCGAASATGECGTASATGECGTASATGDQSAASATGDQSAASATGYRGAASATGDQSAASATGDCGAASATGECGTASATGDHGVALASGFEGKVSGSSGNALFAVERGAWDGRGHPILSVACGIVGQNGIKPNVWYSAKNGVLVEVD